ncbi:hypothetical protein BTN49_3150 [Candidatus Enterovibrio escicola]|uniref:Uncharacterized protein n=1 Tax=Candidatus Enterovibrio escicola TaxID=1927127 RepID=A0A2A5SZD0_9GAMM|nr:hypothetical protein BTN49_3150 [Candidatus Enterovibrio escacola]
MDRVISLQDQSGKFICHQVGRTRRQDERDRFSGKVCETLEEVKEFFFVIWNSQTRDEA